MGTGVAAADRISVLCLDTNGREQADLTGVTINGVAASKVLG